MFVIRRRFDHAHLTHIEPGEPKPTIRLGELKNAMRFRTSANAATYLCGHLPQPADYVVVEVGPQDDALDFRIARLELAAGDILVVQGPRVTAENSHATLEPLVPRGVRILYVPEGVTFSVLTKAEIEAMAV